MPTLPSSIPALLALLLAAAPAFGAGADSAAAARPRLPLPSRRDAIAAAATVAATALVATQDRRWSAMATADDSQRARDLALAARHLGDAPTVAAALLATDGLARLARQPRLGAATERVALACAAAGVVTFAAKDAFGRERPDEAPDAPGAWKPFSGHDAMPSGHATMAFALAGAVTREAHSRWLPFVAWPAATLTAWSRVRDRRHWPSDVLAGAAIGGWTAWRVDGWARRRLPDGLWVVVIPRRGGASVSAGARF